MPEIDRARVSLGFPTSGARQLIPALLYWGAIIVVFAAAVAPPKRVEIVATKILRLFGAESTTLHETARELTFDLLIPLKGALFLVALLVIVLPIARSLIAAAPWRSPGFRSVFLCSIGFFVGLCLIAIPFPHLVFPAGLAHPSGLFLMGAQYGGMSEAPFSENHDWMFRRLLKPAVSYFLFLRGHQAFFVFTLACNFLFVVLSLSFLQAKCNAAGEEKCLRFSSRLLIYFSAMTSCFMLVNLQWPGYPDQCTFALILLAACLPMTAQERCGILALALINHDASVFAFFPIILFCFPRGERARACVVLGLFYVAVFASAGFDIGGALERHGSLRNDSVMVYAKEHPGRLFAGVFFSYKLFWLVLPYVLWRLWQRRDKVTFFAICSMILCPLPLVLIAWDTSRLVAYGFFGMLLAVGILVSDRAALRKREVYALHALVVLNVLVPSYNIILRWDWTPYELPGLYRVIHGWVASL